MGRKAKTIEEKRRPVSVSLSPICIQLMDKMCDELGMTRSAAIEDAMSIYWRFYRAYGPVRTEWEDDDPQPPEIPDDVDEIGYDPFTGCYSEDL